METSEQDVVTNETPTDQLAATTITTSTDATAGLSTAVSSVPRSMLAPQTQLPPRSRRLPVTYPSDVIPARRSSTRSIKRKKFDDELVESSLMKTERGRVKASGLTPVTSASVQQGVHTTSSVSLNSGVTTPVLSTGKVGGAVGVVIPSSTIASTLKLSVAPGVQSPSGKVLKEDMKDTSGMPDATKAVKPVAEKRGKPSGGKSGNSKPSASKGSSGKVGLGGKASTSKVGLMKPGQSKSKSKSKRSRKQKSNIPALKDLGRWKPQDDLALITAVQQTNDLSAVHTGVKFSCCFTLKEIEERWYALLYDQSISKIAMEAARQLTSDTVANIQGKALFSTAEEKLLGTFASNSQPTLESFQNLQQQHLDVFHPARTPKTLQCHWLLMKQFHLLPDQTVQPMPKGDPILNLSDIEDFMNDSDIMEDKEGDVEQELMLADRRNKREIRHLEQEMSKWQVLVDSVTGISMPDFDSQTLGVLRGRLVRYLMRSREISLGRATKDNHVDVDLTLEGPAWKVSRRQGIIKLRNSGDFFIANEGKRPIMVDGKPVVAGNKQKLNNNSVVEISCLRFTFLINQDVINSIRADSSKTVSSANVSGS